MTRYGLKGNRSGVLLTYGGRVLVHSNDRELQFLFPCAEVVRVPTGIPEDLTLPITAHPELAGVRFPLQRRDFQ